MRREGTSEGTVAFRQQREVQDHVFSKQGLRAAVPELVSL